MKYLLVISSIILMSAGCNPEVKQTNSNNQADELWVCSKDAKVCPDGKVVERVGSDCHFPPCVQ